jgi:hypothetical protein
MNRYILQVLGGPQNAQIDNLSNLEFHALKCWMVQAFFQYISDDLGTSSQ